MDPHLKGHPACRASSLIFGPVPPPAKGVYLDQDKERDLLMLCLGAVLELKCQTDPDNRGDSDPTRQLERVLAYFALVKERRLEIRDCRPLSPIRNGSRERHALEALEEGLDESERRILKLTRTFEEEDNEWSGRHRVGIEIGWSPLADAYHAIRDKVFHDDIESMGRLAVAAREAAPDFTP